MERLLGMKICLHVKIATEFSKPQPLVSPTSCLELTKPEMDLHCPYSRLSLSIWGPSRGNLETVSQ